MRCVALVVLMALSLAPHPTFAEDLLIETPVTRAEVYVDGARVIRDANLTAPAGTHRIIVPDLPQGIAPQTISLQVGSAQIGAFTIRNRYQPPNPNPGASPAIEAAEERVATAREALAAFDDQIANVRARAEAAKARIAFLRRIAQREGPTDPDALRATAQMIAEETLTARSDAIAARAVMRTMATQRKDLVRDLKRARAALGALRPPAEDGVFLIADLELSAPYDGPLTLSYIADQAYWRPVYDVSLDRSGTGSLSLDRGAEVFQNSGENWQNVSLRLATLSIYRDLSPANVGPRRRRIEDPAAPSLPVFSRQSTADTLVVEAPVIVEEVASNLLDGLGVVYAVSGPRNIATNADLARVPLGPADLTLDTLYAQANPLRETTAYLMVEATNSGAETLLPSDAARFFVDGVLVGDGYVDAVPAGDRLTLGFGPIDGLQLTRNVLNKNEGDRGVITRSNEQSETIRITLRNLTNRDWDIRLRDRVPFSEQEDLEIDWTATPEPDFVNLDDERGILRWDRTLAAGDSLDIRLEQTLTWPADKVLR